MTTPRLACPVEVGELLPWERPIDDGEPEPPVDEELEICGEFHEIVSTCICEGAVS